MIVSDNEILINAALKNYEVFKVPANKVAAKKSKRYYTNIDKSDLDYRTSENKIGEIVNLSQELNTIMWDYINKSKKLLTECYDDIKDIYHDICILNVLSCIEIDKAKKEFEVSSTAEIKKIKEKWLKKTFDNRTIKPAFLGYIAQIKGYKNPQRKKYTYYDTTMDYVLREINQYRSNKTNTSFIPLSECFRFDGFNKNSINKKQVNSIIKMCESAVSAINAVWSKEYYTMEEKYILSSQYRDDLVFNIQKLKLNIHTVFSLIEHTDMKKYSHISKLLFFVLFNYENIDIVEIMTKLNPSSSYITEDKNGDIDLYGIHFARCGGKY